MRIDISWSYSKISKAVCDTEVTKIILIGRFQASDEAFQNIADNRNVKISIVLKEAGLRQANDASPKDAANIVLPILFSRKEGDGNVKHSKVVSFLKDRLDVTSLGQVLGVLEHNVIHNEGVKDEIVELIFFDTFTDFDKAVKTKEVMVSDR